MSARHPNILYIGNHYRGELLQNAVKADEWHVYQPTSAMEALAFYVFYMPDIVVIDSVPDDILTLDTIGEIYRHLLSVDADPVLVLTDDLLIWNGPVDPGLCGAPIGSIEQIIEGICAMIEARTGEYPVVSMPLTI